jgi:hypothetical protein
MSSPVETALFELLAARPAGKSVDPAEVAKRVDPEGWRRLLPQVKGVAVGLARVGRLEILRHNKPVDPNAFRGVYRLRLPQPPADAA